MNLADLMSEERILTDLSDTAKRGVLQALVDQLVDLGDVENGDQVVDLLLEREELMTTGVQTGFAIPHAFSENVLRPLVALAHVPGGVDWQSLDQKPVRYVFLLLGPPAAQGIHLRLLARVSRLLTNKVFVHRLREAKTAQEILGAIRKTETELALDGVARQGGAQ
jgi:fructose-specific phosphotransferase system IIA component